ncbi:MAG: hypothetical protein WAU75_11530, partial [Solirubrobacteraceae bacterium]
MPTDTPLLDGAELAAGALLAAELALELGLEPLLLLLPHAATISDTPTSAAALPKNLFALQLPIMLSPRGLVSHPSAGVMNRDSAVGQSFPGAGRWVGCRGAAGWRARGFGAAVAPVRP